MPRVRADDYDNKEKSILDKAASLFAEVGYPNAKMQDIAKACGASKSMLYHYFPTKDDLLFAMLEDHLQQLIDDIDGVLGSGATPDAQFLAYVQIYIEKSAQSRSRHVIAMNDVKFLPTDQQQPIQALEARVVAQTTQILQALQPQLAARLYKPYAMLLLGMLNWTDYWYTPNGPIKPPEICERISRLFLDGFRNLNN